MKDFINVIHVSEAQVFYLKTNQREVDKIHVSQEITSHGCLPILFSLTSKKKATVRLSLTLSDLVQLGERTKEDDSRPNLKFQDVQISLLR